MFWLEIFLCDLCFLVIASGNLSLFSFFLMSQAYQDKCQSLSETRLQWCPYMKFKCRLVCFCMEWSNIFDFWWLDFYFWFLFVVAVDLSFSCSQFYQGLFTWLLVSQPLTAFILYFSTNLLLLVCFVRKVTQVCLLEFYPECSHAYSAFWEHLAAGERSVLVA